MKEREEMVNILAKQKSEENNIEFYKKLSGYTDQEFAKFFIVEGILGSPKKEKGGKEQVNKNHIVNIISAIVGAITDGEEHNNEDKLIGKVLFEQLDEFEQKDFKKEFIHTRIALFNLDTGEAGNSFKQYLKDKYKDMEDFISGAFAFEITNKGKSYWLNVIKKHK